MDYQGIKIFNKIIIVEKITECDGHKLYNHRDEINQGYVVDVGNSKMLESAKSWARWKIYDESKRPDLKGNPPYDWDSYYKSAKVVEGIIHEYDNGSFEITLDETAGYSNNGGKLSFWNCIVKAPDGKSFLIGINSELLLHLMMSNTLINGKCQNKIWLGRVRGNQVGAFTENMSEFTQAKKDEETRKTVKAGTKNYVVGDRVTSITEDDIYYGTVKELFTVYEDWGWYGSYQRLIVFNTSDVIKHLYVGNIRKLLKNTKVKRVVKEHTKVNKTACQYIKDRLNERIEYNKLPDSSLKYWFDEQIDLLRVVEPNEKGDSMENIKNKILEYYNYWKLQPNSGVDKGKYYFVKDTELENFLKQNNLNMKNFHEEFIYI